MDFPPRVYDLSLHTVGLILGLLLLVVHLAALLRPEQTKRWLREFPRSRFPGFCLLAVDAVWVYWLVTDMDLREFYQFRTWLQIGDPIFFILMFFFVEEFLAVRALGILALLAADPVLSSAFLRPEAARLLVVILAYIWLTLGLFWVGMPYLLRDQILWITKSASRFRVAALAGLLYGAIILLCALTVYK
jgi:hypothetical protein